MTDASVPPPPDVPPPSMPPAQPQYPVATSTGPLGKPRNIGVCILLTIVTLGFYIFFWIYYQYTEMKEHSGQGLGGLVGLLLGIFIWPVTYFVVPSEIKGLYERDGQQSPITPLWGLWFLFPLFGGLIWFIKVQGDLNRYWVSKGASPV